MFAVLLALFIAFVAADAFVSAAAIYHLWSYTLPGWPAPKIVIPVYVATSLVFIGFALRALVSIPF